MAEAQEIHYLFDARTADGSIDTATPQSVSFPKVAEGGTTRDSDITGGWILRIPEGIDFDQGTDQVWLDLITEKYAALLSSFPGFSSIMFDQLVDGSGFNLASGAGVEIGGRNTTSLGDNGSGATVETVSIPLGSTPVEAIIVVESFQIVSGPGTGTVGALSNPKDGRAQRYFRPLPNGTGMTLDVSFNNGSTFIAGVASGSLINIPGGDQGSDFILRVSRAAVTPNGRIGIGAWAVIYS